ncbi:MAG: pantoate--beta-alanine ligase [Mycobacteriales bacterium]
MSGGPRVVSTPQELAQARGQAGGSVAAVLTMGALHQGHRALLAAARRDADLVLVSIFVNPLQFAADEDLERYPQTLAADLEMCAQEGADYVFVPARECIYPLGPPLVRVCAGPLAERWEGAIRPGHFDGVLTVVLKLLHLMRPDYAYFGEKDAQQLALVRRMVVDLDVAVDVRSVPTVRDSDGLAHSSRNAYLTREQRELAASFPAALFAGAARAGEGAAAVRLAAGDALSRTPELKIDYLAVVDENFTEIVDGPSPNCRLIAAVRLGSTRLIDNVQLARVDRAARASGG